MAVERELEQLGLQLLQCLEDQAEGLEKADAIATEAELAPVREAAAQFDVDLEAAVSPAAHAPAATTTDLESLDRALLAAPQRAQLDAVVALARTCAESEARVTALQAAIDRSDKDVAAVMARLDGMAAEVERTWGRRLRVVEDRVQQDAPEHRTGDSLVVEAGYQALAILLQIAAFLVWLVFQGIKGTRYLNSILRGAPPPLLTPVAAAAVPKPEAGTAPRPSTVEAVASKQQGPPASAAELIDGGHGRDQAG
ncbi:hypothetical protein HK405_002820 [Cladochytrium tenue]|nr:hypothetical protein HK405_002820 [Cladochytrium tenue]